MHNQSIAQLGRSLANGEFSSVELTEHFLRRIKKLDNTYNSFITLMESSALAEARQSDALRSAGNISPLSGIPIAHKDIFCTNGTKTSCASRMLDNFIAPYDATVVERLKNAGAICLGKTNMDEFAMGSSNETSWYGPVRNPWNIDCVPGGSSGGSAACVAARIAVAATGTDTGGSIRQPAALCGVTGIKPTYGRVSRWGMIAFASSLDQGGVIARSAEDCALILSAMAGFDPKDSTSIDHPTMNYSDHLGKKLSGLKVGLPKEFFTGELDPAVQQQIQQAISEYEKMGVIFKDISLPHTGLSVPAYYVIAPAECSSNLSRFDSVRFGHRCDNPINLDDMYKRSRAEGFGKEVKRRILVGTYALSEGYYDAYYMKAQKIRRLIKEDFIKAFEEVDLIMGPTSPTTAFGLNEKSNDPIAMYLADIFTISANLAGLPGLSVPCGFADQKPVGLHIIGNYFEEGALLNAAHQYQQITDWHNMMPAGIE